MRDLFRQELDSLELRITTISHRAAAARDAEALAMLRAAVQEIDASLRELRVQYVHNLSERKRAEDALRRREAEHQHLLDELPCAAWRTEADGRITYVNAFWRQYSGLDAVQTAASWDSVLHPDDQAPTNDVWNVAREAARGWEKEHRLRRRDGVYRWHLTRAHPVRNARGEVREWVATSHDIDDLMEADLRAERLYDEARKTSEQLNRTLESKDEFLGLMSHELKAPITTILGNAEVLLRRDDKLDNEARQAALTDIHHDATRLHRMLEDLLSLARIEGGQTLEIEPLLLGHIVRTVIAEHRRRYPDREFETELLVRDRPALGERGYVEQVVRNLLSNAEKYSSRNKPITITMRSVERAVEVVIGDRGAGLTSEEANAVFQPFVRLPRTALQATGSGIGLAVCKRLIEAQGGQISARPRPGGGSEFGFTLPAAEDPGIEA